MAQLCKMYSTIILSLAYLVISLLFICFIRTYLDSVISLIGFQRDLQ